MSSHKFEKYKRIKETLDAPGAAKRRLKERYTEDLAKLDQYVQNDACASEDKV